MNKAPVGSLRLYHYWRSSSSWRVRWALQVKGVPYEAIAINLLANESESPEHLKRNPYGTVPVLELPRELRGQYLGESMAIIEWLEETHPEPSLLPGDPFQRARIRQLAELINAGTQPLQNLGVAALHSDDSTEQKKWNAYWNHHGLQSYEKLVSQTAGKLSIGDDLTLADLFLIPQCYNALRFDIELKTYPTVHRIYQHALTLPTCQAAHPDRYKP